MAEQITYYAIVNEYSTEGRPGGVLRRSSTTAANATRRSGRDLVWGRSPMLHSAERGDTMNDFYPITEDEAMRIVDRIRRESGTSS